MGRLERLRLDLADPEVKEALQTALAQVALTMSTVMDAAVVSVQDRQRLTALLEQSQEAPSGAPTAAAYDNHSTGIWICWRS